jgi:hypothetical protein
MRLSTFFFIITVLLNPQICLSTNLQKEKLLLDLPKGYKVDFRIKQGNMTMVEMVPKSETVKNWSEMVTTQIFMGLKNTMPETFQSSMQTMWSDSCQNAQFASIAQGVENSYPFSIWIQSCPYNVSTGKQEITLFKAIKGNDNFYLVQKAFKFAPSQEQVTNWIHYFHSVKVCDTRIVNNQCKKVNKKKI